MTPSNPAMSDGSSKTTRVKSMTGAGSSTKEDPTGCYTVSAVSVNRKQLDLVFNLPRELVGVEPELRRRASLLFQRGRVTVSVSVAGGTSSGRPRVDHAAAAALLQDLRTAAARLGLDSSMTMAELARLPGVVVVGGSESIVANAPRALLLAADEAFAQLDRMRAKEGAALARLLQTACSRVARRLPAIRKANETAVRLRREALLAEFAAAVRGADPETDERLQRELLLIAGRADITEEFDRIKIHLAALAEALKNEEAPGRKLEFLAQELGREFHTLGAKTAAAAAASALVECRLDIERIREQIQNVE